MDAESKTAVKLLEGMAEVNQQFLDFAHLLRVRGAQEVSHSLECRAYREGGIWLEGYVDAELKDGGVSWHLDVAWDDEKWLISTSVNINWNIRNTGQETLHDFPDRQTVAFDEFLRLFKEAVRELFTYTQPLES